MSEQGLGVNAEPKPQHVPKFDGGTFTIEYLSTSTNGFEVTTEKSERRRPRQKSDPRFSEKELFLNPEQRKILKNAMDDQMKFAEGDIAKISLDKLRNATTDEEKAKAMAEYQQRRAIYQERAVPTIGLRNIRLNGNTITVDIKPADFPTAREFSKPEASPELLDFASLSSISIILITKDNRLILQHRSIRNKMYGDVPGASVAGYLRGQFDPKKRGVFIPIDTEFVKNDATRETSEELGLDREDLTKLSIVGITHGKVQMHDEFMLFAKSGLTSEEMKEKALKASRNSKLSEEEFDEKFVDISATPNAIFALLTQVKCPIPPTHRAAFFVAGYYMILEQSGIQKASEWKSKLQGMMTENYKEIDRMVEEYYLQNPDILNHVPERHKNSNPRKRNPKGYDPEFLPEEQGLPDLISELKRVELIADDNESSQIMKL